MTILAKTSIRVLPVVRVVTTDEAYTIGNQDNEVHVFSDVYPVPGPLQQKAIKFPANPLIGEEHLIVAATADAVLDGNGMLLVGTATMPGGTAARWVFTADPSEFNPQGSGCCTTPTPSTAIQTGAWIRET